MTPEQIMEAQSPTAGWETATRAFRADAGIDQTPPWNDFADPLEAIARRARARRADHEAAMDAARRGLNAAERRAYEVLGLGFDADRRALRTRYSELVRRYHPDRNGGDRRHEARLQEVVESYNLLRSSTTFA